MLLIPLLGQFRRSRTRSLAYQELLLHVRAPRTFDPAGTLAIHAMFSRHGVPFR